MKMPVPSRNSRDGTASTKPSRNLGGGFCRGRPFLGRAAVCSLRVAPLTRHEKARSNETGESAAADSPILFCETSLIARPRLPMSSFEAPLATLHVENIPRDLYAALRKRAKSNQRSIAAEVRAILKENVPTAREMKERHKFVRKGLRLRAKQPKSSGPLSECRADDSGGPRKVTRLSRMQVFPQIGSHYFTPWRT